jgi:hypothetical protein
MKHYLEPVVETIDIKSADCFMAMGSSDGHGQSSAPKREKEETPF